jgi:DNA-binding NarL/FixJ family response regulator
VRKETAVVRTLIVEDNALFRELFKETLRSRFPTMEIVEASNGEEAFQSIKTSHPDLTFMDIELPGENGLKVTQKIRKLYPDITVIILTGYDWPEYREAAHQYTEYFLSKGLSSRKEILSLVDSIISKRRKKKVHVS